jgi:leucyl-tRNA synthetase
MSKSKGNAVDPDAMIEKYGADALRLYVMFVAPPENEVEWNDAGLEGSFRFLARVWRLVDHWGDALHDADAVRLDAAALSPEERALRRKTHETIRRVTADIEQRQHLNTAVSALMELVNDLYAFSERSGGGAPGQHSAAVVAAAERVETVAVAREAIDALVRMVSPFAPHTAEELWERLGHTEGLTAAGWPVHDAVAARADEVVVPVQVNGKVRARITVAVDASEDTIRERALAEPGVQTHTAGRTVKKVIVARGKLVSVVVA